MRDGRGVEHRVFGDGGRRTRCLESFCLSSETSREGLSTLVGPDGARTYLRFDEHGIVLRQCANGTSELSEYDDEGRLEARLVWKTTRDGAVHAWSVRYEWSHEGDLLRVVDSARGTTRYRVDDAHRLVAELTPQGQEFEYELDAADNVLSKPGLSRVEVTSGNRLVATDTEVFEYDHRDHLSTRRDRQSGVVTRYVYDSFDMLARIESLDPSGAVTSAWEYSYDALGRRTEVRRGAYRREFYWDGDRLAAEVFPSGGLRVYEYGGDGALIPLAFTDYASAASEPKSGRRYEVFSDPVGQPLHIENDRGEIVWWATRVDPYGEIGVDPSAQLEYNLRWPGHYFDPETGLHYNRYRYYDPALGRYLQTDPLGYEGSPTNLYGYPTNPLRDVDVLGLAHPGKAARSRRGDGENEGTERVDPPGTRRDSRGRLRDARTGSFVTDPHATGDYTPDVLATKSRHPGVDGAALDPAADPVVARRLGERDAAIADVNRLRAAGDERGASQAQARANKATEHLGNLAADAAVQRAYPGAKVPPMHSGEGPGTFDRVYENDSPDPPRYIIAEGKGGTASNSSSRACPDGQRHQQGTPEYRESVRAQMAESSDPGTRATGQALRGSDAHYVEVKQPITTTTDPSTGQPTSTLGPISGSTYGAGRPRTP